jgi:CRP-like cAMP-binding protein
MPKGTLFDLSDQPFVRDLDEAHLEVLSSAVIERTTWKAGDWVLRRGDTADVFHLLIDGTISIEIRSPGSAPRTIQTLHGGELIGWSWLYEPYLWTFDARAVQDSSAFTFDSAALRSAIDSDCEFGLVVMKRVTKAIVNRLKATRLQVLDVYNR